MDLASLQTTVSRLSARLNENLSETARDLGLQGIDPASLAGAGTAGKYLEDGTVVTQDGIRETKKLLETRREASMAEGLRRVLAMMLRGLPVITFFPQVVQCLSSSSSATTSSSASNIQIRSLVSIYILRQASFEPDLALLAVNMYQKDLRDPNPVIRALAIRTLAGMELESIVTLVLMSLKTASRDGNWFVRRTVAEALNKVYILDPSHLTSLLPILETGLADAHPLVMGSSLAAFELICPTRFDLLHPHYRRFCKSLVDADEWSQVTILRVLEKYARDQFENPDKGKMDPDLTLLLQCIEPLLWNRNPAVVLSAVRVAYRTAPSSFSKKHAAALARLLQSPAEVQGTVLAAIATIASSQPSVFAEQFIQHFYVYQLSDNQHNKDLKLQILVLLANEANINDILGEFLAYTNTADSAFRQEVIASIGDCAKKVPKVRQSCLKTLLTLLDEFDEDDVTQVLLAEVTDIILEPSIPSEFAKRTLEELIQRYKEDRFELPASKSQFRDLLSLATVHLGNILPDVLDVVRRGVKTFPAEPEHGKSSLLKLSNKALALSQASKDPQLLKIAVTLHTYLLTLGRYDASWSNRAGTRVSAGLTTLLGISISEDAGDADIEQEAFASGEALTTLPTAITPGREADTATRDAVRKALIDTAPTTMPKSVNAVKGATYYERLSGWHALPDWPTKAPQHGLRDSSVQAVAPENKAYRGFGNTTATSTRSSSASSSSKKLGTTSNHSRKRAPQEKVVLVPTETYATASVEKAKPSNLQAFLDSSEEEEEEEEEADGDADGVEDSESEETEDDEEAGGPVDNGDASSDRESENEEESTDTGSEHEGEDARAPLVGRNKR